MALLALAMAKCYKLSESEPSYFLRDRTNPVNGEFWVGLKRSLHAAVGLCLALALGCTRAFAADAALTPAAAADSDGWIITLDLDAAIAPSYPGDETRTTQFHPGISFRRAGTPAGFSAPDDGVDFAVFDQGWMNAGVVGKLVSARSSSGNGELRGLRFVDATIEAGVFVELWPMQNLRTRAELRQGINGHDGLVATLGADWVEKPGAFTLSVGPRLNLGSGTYARTFFSVSPAEALANGRVKPFAATGGLTSVGALAAIGYAFSPEWSGTLYAGYDRLTGSPARSPIVRKLGSRDQFTLGAIISRSFLFKGL